MSYDKSTATYTRLAQQLTARGPWQQSASGTAFYPADPSAQEVSLYDVASALGRICRFNGHLREDVDHYSVAQHAVLVSRWMEEDGWAPRACFAGLHHDSEEAYVGDIISQIKHCNPEIRPFLDRVFEAVCGRFEIAMTPSLEKAIKYYDFVALSTEVRDVLEVNKSVNSWGDLPPPRRERIGALGFRDARALFLARHWQLKGMIEESEL